ncbi:MAG: hypothetical protein Q9157_005014 [Trypethelium eluteriae]
MNRNLFKVDRMMVDDAVSLLYKVFEGPNVPSLNDATSLAASLDYLPLALVQAASYIQRPGMDIQKYLTLLKSDPLSILSKPFVAVGRLADVPHALAATWNVTFKHLRAHHYRAAKLFSCMSFLDPQAIPQSLLPGIKDKEVESKEAISTLISFSLITKRMPDPEAGSVDPKDPLAETYYDVHPLVHLITREWIKVDKKVDIHGGPMLEKVSKTYPDGWLDWPRFRWHSALDPHAVAVLRWTDSLRDKPSRWNRLILLQKRAGRYFLQRFITEAVDSERDCLTLAEELLGPDHSETLLVKLNLVLYSSEVSNTWELLEECRKAVRRSWRLYGIDHPTTKPGILIMGRVLREAGYPELGHRLTSITWDVERCAPEPRWPHIIQLQNRLAADYYELGNFVEAERLLQDILDQQKRHIGGSHSILTVTLYSMWNVKFGMKKYHESERVAEELIACSQSVLGDDLSSYMRGLHGLASSWIAQERYDEAAQLLTNILRTKMNKAGPQDENHFYIREALAVAMLMRNHVSEAIQLQEEALSRVPDIFESLKECYKSRIELWRTIESDVDVRRDFEEWNRPGQRSEESKWAFRFDWPPPRRPSLQREQSISINRTLLLIEDISRGRPRSWLSIAVLGRFGPGWRQRRRWQRFGIMKRLCLENENGATGSQRLIASEGSSWRKTSRVGVLRLKVPRDESYE